MRSPVARLVGAFGFGLTRAMLQTTMLAASRMSSCAALPVGSGSRSWFSHIARTRMACCCAGNANGGERYQLPYTVISGPVGVRIEENTAMDGPLPATRVRAKPVVPLVIGRNWRVQPTLPCSNSPFGTRFCAGRASASHSTAVPR